MPTVSSMQIPPPNDWREFEQIALTSLKIKWESPNLTHNGRHGQAQAGVDIYGSDELGRFVGVQCKRQDELIQKTILSEVKKAESFQPGISAFYFCTTAPTDAKLQKEVRRLSEERVKAGKFPIGIFFWEDIVQELVKNAAELKKHYPELQLRDSSSGARMLSLLDISFYGLNIAEYMQLIFGEFGVMTGEDPHTIQRLTMIVSACGSTVFDNQTGDNLAADCKNLSEYCLSYVSGTARMPEGWRPASALAKKIEYLVATAEYSLKKEELAAFSIGKLLGGWHASAGGDLTEATEKRFMDMLDILKPESSTKEQVLKRIKDYRKQQKDDSMYAHNAAHDLYGIVRKMISHKEMGAGQS